MLLTFLYKVYKKEKSDLNKIKNLFNNSKKEERVIKNSKKVVIKEL